MPALSSHLRQWRTVITVHSALVALFAGLWFCLHWPAGVALFAVYAGAVCTLAGIVATKSAVEHTVNAKAAAAAAPAQPPAGAP